MMVGALVGSQAARRAAGRDRRRRHRRPGHRGRRPHRRDLDDGARARGRRRGRPDVPGARGRRHRPRPQIAAALALGAQGVWTGSIWLTVAESRHRRRSSLEKLLAADSRDTVRSRAMTGKPARQLRTAWTEAWERADTPGPLPMPLQGILYQRARRAGSAACSNAGADRVPGRPDRRPHEPGAPDAATSSSTWSRSGSRPPSASSRSPTSTDPSTNWRQQTRIRGC